VDRRKLIARSTTIGAVAVVLLTAVTIGLRREPIETDLTQRATAALTAAGFADLDVQFDGRDATVTGTADDLVAALDVVGGLEGVRVVDGSVRSTTPPESTTTTATVAAATDGTGDPPPPPTESTFTLRSDGGSLSIAGRIPSQEVADQLVASASAAYPGLTIRDGITVDPGATSPLWLPGLPAAIEAIGATLSNPELDLSQTGLAVGGLVPSEQARTETLAVLDSLGLPVQDGLRIAPSSFESELNAVVDTATILFASGSADISAEGRAALDAIASVLAADQRPALTVAGHTDDVGSIEDNQVLSEARARSVIEHLVANGVQRGRLNPIGFGESRPVASNESEEGRAANRRIEFIVEGN
jgi:OOP family OmpA-OmpF porin